MLLEEACPSVTGFQLTFVIHVCCKICERSDVSTVQSTFVHSGLTYPEQMTVAVVNVDCEPRFWRHRFDHQSPEQPAGMAALLAHEPEITCHRPQQ